MPGKLKTFMQYHTCISRLLVLLLRFSTFVFDFACVLLVSWGVVLVARASGA